MHTATTLCAALRGVIFCQPTWLELVQVRRESGCWKAESMQTIRERSFSSLLNPKALVEIGRRSATCKLRKIRRESPLVMMVFNRTRRTGGLEGRDATGGPGTLFQPVERPAPTGPGRFLDLQPKQHPLYCRLLCAPISALARGASPRNCLLSTT